MEKMLTLENLPLLLFVVFPGFVAVRALQVMHPPEKREIANDLVDAFVFGTINGAFWLPFFVLIEIKDVKAFPLYYSFWFLLACCVSPMGMAWVVGRVRKSKSAVAALGHTTRSAWEWYWKDGKPTYALFHLKSGRTVGGFMGRESYVTLSSRQEIYLQKVLIVDQETGVFGKTVDRTAGAIIRLEECSFVELYEDEDTAAPIATWDRATEQGTSRGLN